ncbi:MAG: OmpP1/FadL family transporter [Brevirhabdus sp.]
MISTKTKGAVYAVAATLAMTTAASATSGYFALGYGTAQRSLGGAGVAHAFEAMSAAVNPAAAARVGNQLQLGAELFMPERGYTATGTFFVPPGSVDSANTAFIVPNFGYNRRLDNGAALNLTVYGNGGMNSSYAANGVGCGSTFCAGDAGVDLTQLFVSLTYADTIGNVSWGIAPTIVAQRFGAKGLGAFAGITTNPSALTNTGYDWSFGIGLRAGMIVDVTDRVRFGASAQLKTNMTEFDKYAGLFAQAGDFDIPASATVGLAFDATDKLTIMADYQKIWYSKVASIGNGFTPTPLGAANGPGFGWDDVGVIKLGVEYRASDQMTWRAGWARASNPIGTDDVTLNILAPGVVENHFAFGGTYKMNERDSIDFGVVYTPEVKVSGAEVTPGGPTPGIIELNMHQYEISVGWTRKF